MMSSWCYADGLRCGLNHAFYAMIKKQDIVTEEVWEREWKEREWVESSGWWRLELPSLDLAWMKTRVAARAFSRHDFHVYLGSICSSDQLHVKVRKYISKIKTRQFLHARLHPRTMWSGDDANGRGSSCEDVLTTNKLVVIFLGTINTNIYTKLLVIIVNLLYSYI